jgi:hypothetical protein
MKILEAEQIEEIDYRNKDSNCKKQYEEKCLRIY